MIKRRLTIPVKIAHVTVGGEAPVVIQSMTDTDTADRARTVTQIKALADTGSELVRITVNNEEAAEQVPYICEDLESAGYHVPIIGDFHYNGHTLLTQYPDCAKTLAKYRINPGNVGFGAKKDKQFAQMIEVALINDKPVRIGVNWGSLDKAILAKLMDENGKSAEPKSAQQVMHEAIVQSAVGSAQMAEELGLPANKIVLSTKVSQVQDLIAVYRMLADRCSYALHLGLTEAGMGSKSIVASSIGMGILLQEGIGDTIRTSLTPEPGAERTREVRVSQEILQTMGIRSFMPMVTACPGCGRTTSAYFRELAQDIQNHLCAKMSHWKQLYPGVETMSVAVMGCIVNGPGESKHANIGISLPGTGEEPVAPVFVDGEKAATLRGSNIAAEFTQMVDNYVVSHYGEQQA